MYQEVSVRMENLEKAYAQAESEVRRYGRGVEAHGQTKGRIRWVYFFFVFPTLSLSLERFLSA